MGQVNELVASVLAGPFEAEPWLAFVQQLREATEADHTTLILRPPGRPMNEALHIYAGTATNDAVREVYLNHLTHLTPLGEFDMEEGKVYSFADFYPPKDERHRSFYEKILVSRGIQDARMMRVMEPTGVNAWLSISAEGRALNDEVDAIVQATAMPLRASLRFYVELERERFAAGVSGDALHSLHFGWIGLDANGTVIECDEGGRVVLARSRVLYTSSAGKMTARSKPLEKELAAGIHALVTEREARPVALVLSRDPWLDMLLVRSTKTKLAAKSAPVVIAYVHGDSWGAADRCTQLAEMFSLSSSEARLALALSRGRTLTEAAGDLGLSVETVRSYSKAIYAKTGARGQADLVRIVLRSVMAFSPER